MSRRLRRLPVLLLPLVLATTLVACGSDSDSSSKDEPSSSASDGIVDGVKIAGEPGMEPRVTWDGKMDADKIETTVLEKGDGDEVADGDQVNTQIWIGNGFTNEKAYSTYDAGTPETVTVSDQLSPVFKDALAGQTIGSRVVVTAPASEAFGEAGNPQLNIGNKDTVLIVLDLIDMYQPPKPTDVPQSKMPGVVEKKGVPVSLDFKGLPKPKADGDLLRTVVKEGKGEPVTTEMTVTANYLGQVYDGKKPFDESFSKEPVPFALTAVVKGWTYGLEGLKVGSRVLLQIPPSLGYGAQEQAGIPANSTLYFVIDIVSAK